MKWLYGCDTQAVQDPGYIMWISKTGVSQMDLNTGNSVQEYNIFFFSNSHYYNLTNFTNVINERDCYVVDN
ncbi:unnamed protein product [Larinioides sclopetarius]|uniref:Uncharacterized protein n=1 Tax=Larinioides sclopetarius TaxID=280406 RepID=A0AAV2BUT2_9ARAC